MTAPSPPSRVPLLDAAEVATLLYVDLATVARWAEAGKLVPVDTRDGVRRFARADVLRLMVDIKRTKNDAASRSPRAPARPTGRRDHDVAVAEGALDVTMTQGAVTAAELLTTQAATQARRLRVVAGRAAEQVVADEAAHNVVATRFRADAAATRVRKAAELAAADARGVAGARETDALERAIRTAATVEAAAVAVAEETAMLARAVAEAVETAAERMAGILESLDRAIEAEVIEAEVIAPGSAQGAPRALDDAGDPGILHVDEELGPVR